MFPSLWKLKLIEIIENQNQTNKPHIKRERSNYCTMSILWFSVKSLYSLRERVYNFVGICNARDSHEADRKRGPIGFIAISLSSLVGDRSLCKRS